MSPFQSQVIDATLAEFDRNRAIQEQGIRDQQAALGALGSGRAGVQLAEFGTGAARERALLQAGLLQQGFGQAAAQRQQDIANRGALATQQLGLGQFQTGLGQLQQQATGTDIQRLGSLGALNQAQQQAQLDAQREAARQATFLPQEQLDRFAGQVTGIMGGYPGQFQSTITPNPTPLQTALGLGTTLAGIYGATQTRRLTCTFRFKLIMNRVLKRPMFRIGGSAGTGITSGLDQPRKQYANGSEYNLKDYERERRMIEEMMRQEQLRKEMELDLKKKKIREQKQMAADGGRIGYANGTPNFQFGGVPGFLTNFGFKSFINTTTR